MKPLLALRSVTLERGGRIVFEGLNLVAGPGDAIHVAGPNGSGKSSLLRLVAGLLEASAGSVERCDCALADDLLALDSELPLGRALAFWTGAKSGRAIGALGLDGLENAPVRHLSSGQRRRAGIARVVASGARLWLLDEPANGLDRESLAMLDRAIAEHRATGGAVLAAAHGALTGDWARLELGR